MSNQARGSVTPASLPGGRRSTGRGGRSRRGTFRRAVMGLVFGLLALPAAPGVRAEGLSKDFFHVLADLEGGIQQRFGGQVPDACAGAALQQALTALTTARAQVAFSETVFQPLQDALMFLLGKTDLAGLFDAVELLDSFMQFQESGSISDAARVLLDAKGVAGIEDDALPDLPAGVTVDNVLEAMADGPFKAFVGELAGRGAGTRGEESPLAGLAEGVGDFAGPSAVVEKVQEIVEGQIQELFQEVERSPALATESFTASPFLISTFFGLVEVGDPDRGFVAATFNKREGKVTVTVTGDNRGKPVTTSGGKGFLGKWSVFLEGKLRVQRGDVMYAATLRDVKLRVECAGSPSAPLRELTFDLGSRGRGQPVVPESTGPPAPPPPPEPPPPPPGPSPEEKAAEAVRQRLAADAARLEEISAGLAELVGECRLLVEKAQPTIGELGRTIFEQPRLRRAIEVGEQSLEHYVERIAEQSMGTVYENPRDGALEALGGLSSGGAREIRQVGFLIAPPAAKGLEDQLELFLGQIAREMGSLQAMPLRAEPLERDLDRIIEAVGRCLEEVERDPRRSTGESLATDFLAVEFGTGIPARYRIPEGQGYGWALAKIRPARLSFQRIDSQIRTVTTVRLQEQIDRSIAERDQTRLFLADPRRDTAGHAPLALAAMPIRAGRPLSEYGTFSDEAKAGEFFRANLGGWFLPEAHPVFRQVARPEDRADAVLLADEVRIGTRLVGGRRGYEFTFRAVQPNRGRPGPSLQGTVETAVLDPSGAVVFRGRSAVKLPPEGTTPVTGFREIGRGRVAMFQPAVNGPHRVELVLRIQVGQDSNPGNNRVVKSFDVTDVPPPPQITPEQVDVGVEPGSLEIVGTGPAGGELCPGETVRPVIGLTSRGGASALDLGGVLILVAELATTVRSPSGQVLNQSRREVLLSGDGSSRHPLDPVLLAAVGEHRVEVAARITGVRLGGGVQVPIATDADPANDQALFPFTVGRCGPPPVESFVPGIQQAVTDLFNALEQEDMGLLESILAPAFRTQDRLGLGQARPRFLQAARSQFENLDGPSYRVDVGAPRIDPGSGGAAIDLRWDMRARFQNTGLEWQLVSQESRIFFQRGSGDPGPEGPVPMEIFRLEGDNLIMTNDTGATLIDRGMVDGATVTAPVLLQSGQPLDATRAAALMGTFPASEMEAPPATGQQQGGFTPQTMGPDLIVVPGSVSFTPPSPQQLTFFTVNLQVQNIGSQATTNSQVLLSIDGIPAGSTMYGGLIPGEVLPLTFQASFFMPGTFATTATADPNMMVAEGDEANNVTAGPMITVQP